MFEQDKAVAEVTMPAEVRARFDGQLDGQTIVAWAEYDVDEANHYAQRYAVLTEELLIVLDGAQRIATSIKQIKEAKITEGLGVDELLVLRDGAPPLRLRYSRRQRRGMTRLQRRRRCLQRGQEAPQQRYWCGSRLLSLAQAATHALAEALGSGQRRHCCHH
jgi:hypothetical protein